MQSAFDWDIDFDAWSELANTDPHAFERQRSELVGRVIECSNKERQPRLRRLQWRIDKVRERAPTPLAACIRLSSMMWDSVMGEGGLHEALQTLRYAKPKAGLRRKATVLPFRGPSAG
jgi:hypothetical protein